MEPIQYFVILLITIFFSAYFTNAQFALLSVLKLGLEIDLNSESLIAKLKKTIKTNPAKYIATLAIGSHIVLAVSTISFAGLLFPFFENYYQSKSVVILLITLTTALVILIFGNLLPKTIFRLVPNNFLPFYLIPLTFFSFLFYPVTRIIFLITSALEYKNSKTDKNTDHKNRVFGRIGLDWVSDRKEFAASEKKESIETEAKLFKNALDFSKVKLREIMVPRTEIEMLDLNSSMNELRQRFVDTGYSRILFYDENIDNIVGYVHSSVVFKNPETFKPFINNVLIVPETMPANKLLSTFIREHRSIAIVVDEFGGTSGMVTSEDILEEIFGEIEDEHDTIDIIEKKISETEFVFSGRSEIDLINEKYQINLPESEDFETLAGFILFHHESIPKINTSIKIGAFQFKILKATNTKIELVKLTIVQE
jgi:CBS domain containing-hemolysin-like protein